MIIIIAIGVGILLATLSSFGLLKGLTSQFINWFAPA